MLPYELACAMNSSQYNWHTTDMTDYILVRVPTKKAILTAIAKAGGQRQLGEVFGVSQQAIYKWAHDGKVPIKNWNAILKYIR